MAGTSNITGLESITFTDNASFDGTERGGAMTTNGQLWIGSTVGRHVKLGQLTSPSGTLSIGYSSPNITLDLAGGSIGIDSVAVQTGTSPVVPTVAGLLTINGAVVAAGTNPVRSDGTGANTMAIEVQISQAVAATDATKIGLANFNSAQFTVDANGFVSTSGTGIPNTITGQSGGALSPTAGNWNINGGTVVAGTSPLVTSGSGSTLTINAQRSQALAAADNTKIGLSNFDSSSFAVDANGFVTLSTTGALKTLTGNSGGAISPTANNINTLGTGSITIVGSGSTLTTQLTGITNHAIQIGAGTATLTQLAATATTGQILQNNASADPTWSTATYPSTVALNAILYGSALNVVSGLAPVNRAVLASTSGGLPSWKAMTDGQLIIGSSAAQPAAATLTAGTGISITNGSNSITIATSTGGYTWSDASGAFSPLKENGYFITATATGTLPAAPANGDTIKFFVDTTQILTIQATAGKIIRFSSAVSAAAGTAVSSAQGDSVELVYRTTNTCWCAVAGFSGNWNVT